MCLFLRYVMTFDKKERKIHLIDYIYYNVKETKVSCLHQKGCSALFLCSNLPPFSITNIWNLFLAEAQAFLIMSASLDEIKSSTISCDLSIAMSNRVLLVWSAQIRFFSLVS